MFFHRASANTGGVNANKDATRFEQFQKGGVTAVPGYTLPEYVLQLADTVLAHKNPLNFFRGLRVSPHSSISAPA